MHVIRYSFDGQGVVNADGRTIAQDNPANPTSGADLREMVKRANAAPEMLAALRYLLPRVHPYLCDGAELAKARAAIAKAEG